MATYQTVKIGRSVFREDFVVSESSDGSVKTLALTGRESMGANGMRTRLQVEQRREDIMGMVGDLVPVVFTQKTTLNGFYRVTDATADITNWDNVWTIANWTCNLLKVGVESDVDIESRLSGAITRQNDFTTTGKRFHAPAVGHKVYWAGSTTPIYIDRVGVDGSVRMYQNLAQGINPRWACSVTNYEKGRVRFIDHNGLERSGLSFNTSAATWELSNSLIRVKPGSAGNTIDVANWNGVGWQIKTWDILYNTGPAVSVGVFDYVSVLENTFESVTIRLTKDLVPGRMVVDMTLRRGASIVEMYISHEFSTTLNVKRFTVVAGTSTPGYVAQTTADADGVKTIVGSARTFTADAVNHGISKAATAVLDAFIGVSMSSATWNAPADIYTQYIGSPAEMVRGVRR